MTCSSSRIDPAARRLLSSIAGTRDARVSAMALAHMRGAGKTLMDAGLLVQRGSSMSVVAEEDLDAAPAPADDADADADSEDEAGDSED